MICWTQLRYKRNLRQPEKVSFIHREHLERHTLGLDLGIEVFVEGTLDNSLWWVIFLVSFCLL